MGAKLEELLVASLLVISAVAFVSTFFLQGFSLTKEEALEISRKSETIQRYMDRVVSYSVQVEYWNRTQVNRVREDFPNTRKVYPENRNIWIIVWIIKTTMDSNSSASVINHVIDDETGQIVYEGQGGLR